MNTLKITPLNTWHKKYNANMANFGGFEMPLWYESGIKAEHLGLLKSVGIFDTSHMDSIQVDGKDAFTLLNYCFTRDLTNLKNGKCAYGIFLTELGYSLDDALVYKFSQTSFMVCVNAGMGDTIANHLKNYDKYNAKINNLARNLAKMDIQGINSAKILSKVLQNSANIFEKFPFFSVKGNFDESYYGPSEIKLLDNNPCMISRTGYTGEFGFEIFVKPQVIVKLWQDIIEVGKEFNLVVCGLGARDSLRAGAGLPLSHQDIGNWEFINNPWDFALAYNETKTDFTKNFLGKEKLLLAKNKIFTYAFVGKNSRKVGNGENSQVLYNDQIIGNVLTCTTDMAITWQDEKLVSINSPNLTNEVKGVSCGFIKTNKKLQLGTSVILKEKKREVKVIIANNIRPDKTARKKIENFI